MYSTREEYTTAPIDGYGEAKPLAIGAFLNAKSDDGHPVGQNMINLNNANVLESLDGPSTGLAFCMRISKNI